MYEQGASGPDHELRLGEDSILDGCRLTAALANAAARRGTDFRTEQVSYSHIPDPCIGEALLGSVDAAPGLVLDDQRVAGGA
jgi:hypothetical protein